MRFFVKGQRGSTCVSNIFIDNYMIDANGEFVKIYLYLLRAVNIGERISIADIADKLDHTQRDIARALKYWERRGLLELEFDDSGELDGLCLVEPETLADAEQTPPEGSVIAMPPASTATPSIPEISGDGTTASMGAAPPPFASSPEAIEAGRVSGIPAGFAMPQTAINGPADFNHTAKPFNGFAVSHDIAVETADFSHTLKSPNGFTMSQGTAAGAADFSHTAKSPNGFVISQGVTGGQGGDLRSTQPAVNETAVAPHSLQTPADEETRELLFITEQYMGHPLSATEINTVLYWYTQMHMRADLIDFLVGYCVDRGHKSIHYMNKVALNWAEQGITNVSAARRENMGHNAVVTTVMDSFGIAGRNLTKFENAFLDRWSNTYGFSPEMIEEACRRTIMTAHTPDFKYADSILKSWHNSGVKTLSDVEKKDTAHQESVKSKLSVISSNKPTKHTGAQNKFHNFQGREYDFAALEESLLQEN